MSKKQVSFAITDLEHENIKILAAKERRTIKQLVLDSFDKLYPNWNKQEEIKNDTK